VKPPAFMVLSATLHLPLPLYDLSENNFRKLEMDLRNIMHSPEDFLRDFDRKELAPLIAEKKALIGERGSDRQKRKSFRRLKEINAILFERVKPIYNEKAKQMEDRKRQIEWNNIVGRRDYPFCIYPEEKLEDFYRDIIQGIS
jgi:hypothetical protein